jgi:hypothetical protein
VVLFFSRQIDESSVIAFMATFGMQAIRPAFFSVIFMIVAVAFVNSIRTSSGRSNSTVAHEVTNYAAYNGAFHTTTWPCKSWESWSNQNEKADCRFEYCSDRASRKTKRSKGLPESLQSAHIRLSRTPK